jgi:hypothetical protein
MSSVGSQGARRLRVIGFMVVGAIAVILIGGRIALAIGPLQAAQRFCSDLTSQNYQDLYSRMTASMQTLIDRDTFVAGERLADTQAGAVTQCDASFFSVDVGLGSATAHVSVHRAQGAVDAVPLHLTGWGWQIATLPDPALLPFATAWHWCEDLTHQNYAAAYVLLAPAITTSLPQERFASLAQLADQTQGTVTTCSVTALTYNPSSATATVAIARPQSSSASLHLSLGRQSDGAWLLSSLPDL